MQYWEDDNYKAALTKYSEFNQMCLSLNQFNPQDCWAFEKRDKYAIEMNRIKESYKAITE